MRVLKCKLLDLNEPKFENKSRSELDLKEKTKFLTGAHRYEFAKECSNASSSLKREIVEIGSPSWQIVSEIQTLTDPEQWFHCRGKENPADLLSRGESAVNLVKSSLWAHGPSWISQPECDWPMKQQREIDEESVLSEKRSQPVNALQVSDKNAKISYPTRFISFQ
ncbi:hypothetical protein AVEN_124839-1 [Araneus ventricosus]|uniref:Uncharacterized protein n=1 Tax=Araneus ventricosus TaxID=182803 RepID=A0A4Y2VV91_ARAVE|nr:hypothetical protein AVEN_124839-1 [Araneus ventricosus]